MPALVQQYRVEGYCVVPNLLAASTLDAALNDMDLVIRSQLDALGVDVGGSLHDAMERLLNADVDCYVAAVRHLNKLLSVQDLLFDAGIRQCLAELGVKTSSVPSGPVVSIMSDRLRIPGGYFGLAAHQDWASIQGSLDSVTIWAPLLDVAATQFPLQVIPQSHLRGLWDGVVTDSNREIEPSQFEESDFLSLAMNRGDVVFMSAFTVHRTGMSYAGEACRGLRIACNTRVESSFESTFVRRRFPCAYGRTVARQLMTPDFPQPSDVERVFGAPRSERALA